MRILFVTDLAPVTKGEKGLPLTLFNFISDFKKLGAKVILLRPNVIPNILLRKRKLRPDGVYEYAGIKCINKNFISPFFKSSQFEFLKNEKFDIILSHMPSGILAANKISKTLNIPYIAAVHASDIKVLTDIKYFFLQKAMLAAYLEAACVACRSYWLKDRIEKLIPKTAGKTYIIPSGIDLSAVISTECAAKKTEQFSSRPLKIFSAASLIKRKNFDLLIKAVAKTSGTVLSIAGEGAQGKRLRELVKKLGIKDRVQFTGQLSKEEVYAQMKTSHVFALISSNETFGMVYLEALAKGCIVICAQNNGMAGFIKDGENGFLADGNLPELIDKISRLDLPGKIIENAVKTAKEMESLKMAQNYLKLARNIFLSYN